MGAHNNTISGNSISNSAAIGLCIEYISDGNSLFHNNFVNNTQSAYDECNNTWDNGYPSGGNYWSEYVCVDLYSGPARDEPGSDGIADTPYGDDRYPLMGPWTITGQNVTVSPSINVTVTYANVTTGGITTINTTISGFNPPTGFKISGNYYDIQTSANYTGTVSLGFTCNDEGMTLLEELNLKLMQWNASFEEWQDITTWVDTTLNRVYGQTASLSWFTTFLKLLGDIDVDGDVDIFDIVYMATLYGATSADPQYELRCDINCDGDIDIFDIVIAAGNYGEELP